MLWRHFFTAANLESMRLFALIFIRLLLIGQMRWPLFPTDIAPASSQPAAQATTAPASEGPSRYLSDNPLWQASH
jgi:hypothetical protein